MQTEIKKRSLINLVDLAGSERAKKTGASGEALKVCVISAHARQFVGDVNTNLWALPLRMHGLSTWQSWSARDGEGRAGDRSFTCTGRSEHQLVAALPRPGHLDARQG